MWYAILHLLYSIDTAFVVQYTTYVVCISEKIEANFKNNISTWNLGKNLSDYENIDSS